MASDSDSDVRLLLDSDVEEVQPPRKAVCRETASGTPQAKPPAAVAPPQPPTPEDAPQASAKKQKRTTVAERKMAKHQEKIAQQDHRAAVRSGKGEEGKSKKDKKTKAEDAPPKTITNQDRHDVIIAKRAIEATLKRVKGKTSVPVQDILCDLFNFLGQLKEKTRTIRGWESRFDSICESLQGTHVAGAGRPHNEHLRAAEDLLVEWMNNATGYSEASVIQYAKEIISDKEIRRTQQSVETWLREVMKRHALSFKNNTESKQLVEGWGPALSQWIATVKAVCRLHSLEPVSVDEVPFYYQTKAGRSLVPVGTKSVKSKADNGAVVTRKPRERATIILAVSASGKKFKPYFIFKGLPMPANPSSKSTTWSKLVDKRYDTGVATKGSVNSEETLDGQRKKTNVAAAAAASFVRQVQHGERFLWICDAYGSHQNWIQYFGKPIYGFQEEGFMITGPFIEKEVGGERVKRVVATHIWQVIDLGVGCEFQTKYNPLLDVFVKTNCRLPTASEARTLAIQAWNQVDVESIKKCWLRSGIVPCDRAVHKWVAQEHDDENILPDIDAVDLPENVPALSDMRDNGAKFTVQRGEIIRMEEKSILDSASALYVFAAAGEYEEDLTYIFPSGVRRVIFEHMLKDKFKEANLPAPKRVTRGRGRGRR